ncbi:methyl-accepting chemotaxis protein [Magnetospirillum sp. SS-4]|uniref:methyl-accepting chemotaxis protein n=1 Tax=Magnetospirillum sp. SS-4 TaxID=2681465 RepID=UPI0013854E2B|nr:methyl-accepting chemotaxis protein [Magnetospirillum sp. SS-4]CAA7624879.1 putative Methyl-accepting chemotaxis protein [Magnetospirillum sp. SS-4]
MNLDTVTAEISGLSGRLSLPRRLRQGWDSGDMALLGDMPIRLRFGLLVLMALVAAATYGTVTHLAERHMESMLAAQDNYRRLNDLAGDVRAGAAVLQNLQELFVRERDMATADSFRREIDQMRRRLDTVTKLAADGPMTQAANRAGSEVGAIAAGFERVVAQSAALGLTEDQGLRAQLNASTKAIESELAQWPNVGPMSFLMARLRLAERDFMLYGEEASLRRHQGMVTQFDLAIDGSPLPASTREDFRKLLVIYAADLRAFAEGTRALTTELAGLRTGVGALQPAMQQILGFTRQGMADAIAAQDAERRATSRMVAVVGSLAAISFMIACLVLARSISQPIRRIQSAMEHLANGDHAVAVPGIRRKDEIGEMARAVAVFKENAIAMVRLQAEQHSIRAETEAANRTRLLSLANSFEDAVKRASDMVATNSVAIRETAERMAARIDSGENGSLTVAEAANQCRQTVAKVAEAADELGLSVDDITRCAGQASLIVQGAVLELDRSTDRIHSLSEVAGRIDRVVSLISEIAGRTNMLALNAAIEAQRAGEAGKGFAVVAGEVKLLAQQTAQSTREIAEQIAAIQAATADTVSAIDSIGGAIRRMDDIAAQVSAAVSRQSDVTRRISGCVDEVIADTRIVSEGVAAVTQSAARYCGSAIAVMWAAEDLAGPAATLDREVDGFLSTVRG